MVSNPLLDGGSTDYSYSFLDWHSGDSALCAVPRIVASDSRQLATINETNGNLSFLGSAISNCCWTSDGAGALDEANDIFYFLGSLKSESSSQHRLYSLNVNTGAVIDNPLLGGGSTTYSYNFVEVPARPHHLRRRLRESSVQCLVEPCELTHQSLARSPAC